MLLLCLYSCLISLTSLLFLKGKSNTLLFFMTGSNDFFLLFYGCLLDKGAWWAIVHGVTELDTTEQLTHTGPDVLHLKYNDKFWK